jgi:hypothetical protein
MYHLCSAVDQKTFALRVCTGIAAVNTSTAATESEARFSLCIARFFCAVLTPPLGRAECALDLLHLRTVASPSGVWLSVGLS